MDRAILEQHKTIENRSVRLPTGWIALHTGVGKLPQERGVELAQLCPGIPDEYTLPHGSIVGAMRVDRACTVDDCAGTPTSPWAFGPVCNVIGAVCTLSEPIPHKGDAHGAAAAAGGVGQPVGRLACGVGHAQLSGVCRPHAGMLGVWPIESKVLQRVRAGLSAATVKENRAASQPPSGMPPAGAAVGRGCGILVRALRECV